MTSLIPENSLKLTTSNHSTGVLGNIDMLSTEGIGLLVTVFDAILTSRQTREKFIQGLYENLMSNNFRKAALLKKI